MTYQMMTFHESYGHLPMRLLRTYKSANVSPADHDAILLTFGYTWQDVESIPGIPGHVWDSIMEFVQSSIQDGTFYMSRYM